MKQSDLITPGICGVGFQTEANRPARLSGVSRSAAQCYCLADMRPRVEIEGTDSSSLVIGL